MGVPAEAQKSMREAARILDGFAKDLKDCHTVAGKWQVMNKDELAARYEYLALRRLSRRLRKNAKEL